VAEDRTATLVESADGSTRVISGEAADDPKANDGAPPPQPITPQ
jgi:hypothetical protein